MKVNMVNMVKGFILAKPTLADNDVDLIYAIWSYQLGRLKPSKNIKKMTARELMQLWKYDMITTPAYISRARRKCQEHYPETRGEKYVKRKQHQKDVKQNVKAAAREANRTLSERSSR